MFQLIVPLILNNLEVDYYDKTFIDFFLFIDLL